MKKTIREVGVESGSCVFTIQFTEGSDDKEIQIWGDDGEIRFNRDDLGDLIETLNDFA